MIVDIIQVIYSISQGNQKAFRTFYDYYYARVFRFAFYFLGDKRACGEIVTNVFLSVWLSREKIREIRNMEAYLYTITKNEASRYLASSSNPCFSDLQNIPLMLEATSEPSPEEDLFAKELMEIINRAVNELPERCRLIFLMSHQEGLKSKEIAQILTLNESTVRVQLRIALRKIKERIKASIPNLILALSCLLNLFK